MDLSTRDKSRLVNAALALVILAAVFFAVKVVAEVKGLRFIGGGAPASNTVSFRGEGEASGAPNLATISLTIREEAKEVKDAQAKVTAKEKAVLDFLDKSGIAKKDIKTENYNWYPKFDYGTPCYRYGMPCTAVAPKITAYETTENITVKIRDLSKTGEVMSGIGEAGVAEMNGPNFTIENEDELRAQARKDAIEEAKAKAEVLARDLGVHLVRIVSFSEDGNYPMPYYKNEMMAADSAGSAPAPALPIGENKIVSNVTITYEIR